MEHEEPGQAAGHAADAHGAAEHASAGFPPFDQVDTFPSQLFWLVVTFGALYLFATFWLIPNSRCSRLRSGEVSEADWPCPCCENENRSLPSAR